LSERAAWPRCFSWWLKPHVASLRFVLYYYRPLLHFRRFFAGFARKTCPVRATSGTKLRFRHVCVSQGTLSLPWWRPRPRPRAHPRDRQGPSGQQTVSKFFSFFVLVAFFCKLRSVSGLFRSCVRLLMVGCCAVCCCVVVVCCFCCYC